MSIPNINLEHNEIKHMLGCPRSPHLNLGFEFLIVDVDGIVLIVLGSSSQQAVCHFNIQQVVQHLNFSLNNEVRGCYEIHL